MLGEAGEQKNLSFMSNKKENEELQSRREFFKKAAKAALPVVAMTVAQMPAFGYVGGVVYDNCQNCASSCSGTCAGNCKGDCTGSNSNANGGCFNGCVNTCAGGCTGTCYRSCNTGCDGYNYY